MSLRGEILPVGDAAVLAVLGDTITPETVARVWSLHASLKRALGDAIADVAPAYGSVLVRFNPSVTQLAIVMATVRGAMETADETAASHSRTVDVGVSFSAENALDLEDVAAQTGLRPDEVRAEFCRPTYRVAFLGFIAGFPYLIGLSEKLKLPRLATPRVRVPAGSVGFAAGQAGIYPRASPGGWRIVGKTSATIFDPKREHPATFRPGDAVRFHPVTSLNEAQATIV
ncbi:MAG TPA: 5-oxoprolinase subunit PxpB [Candidatus Eremiobacteraceae bacterium]|nr:5-oxoprolinase subunit PxpB [Candidatus Eremiobacteraceae bacterium]